MRNRYEPHQIIELQRYVLFPTTFEVISRRKKSKWWFEIKSTWINAPNTWWNNTVKLKSLAVILIFTKYDRKVALYVMEIRKILHQNIYFYK